MNIIQKWKRKWSFFKANTYLHAVANFLKKDNYLQALSTAEKTNAIYQKYLPELDPQYSLLYLQFAFIYNKIKNFEVSLSYVKKCLIIEEKHPVYELEVVGSLYSLLAINYIELGDYKNGLFYLKQSIITYQKKYSDTDEKVMNVLSVMKNVLNDATKFLSKKEYNEYKKWFDDLIKEINSNPILKK